MTNESYKHHEVQKGETLSQILKKYYGGYSKPLAERVLAGHNIVNPNAIPAGLVLNLQGSWSHPKPEMEVYDHPNKAITTLTNKSELSDTPAAEPKKLEKDLPRGEYWAQLYKKDLIVLHFTAGYTWRSAYNTFLRPGRVATPYIVDVTGPLFVVQLFDPKFWSYHLGIKKPYSNNWNNDKRSIGIEIVNIGPVWKKGIHYKDYTGKIWPEGDVVVAPNRDADGGVRFPEEQIYAVCDLINWLCQEFDIPRQVPADKMSMQLPEVGEFKGIATHQHFRKDKYDMGSAFPWDIVTDRCGLEEVDLT